MDVLFTLVLNQFIKQLRGLLIGCQPSGNLCCLEVFPKQLTSCCCSLLGEFSRVLWLVVCLEDVDLSACRHLPLKKIVRRFLGQHLFATQRLLNPKVHLIY